MSRSDFWEWEPNSYSVQIITSTDIADFGSGVEHRRRRWRHPRYLYTYTYDKTRADLITMFQFFESMGGQYDELYVVTPEPRTQRFTVSGAGSVVLTEAVVPSISNVRVQVNGRFRSSSTFSLNRTTRVLTLNPTATGTLDVEWYECVLARFVDPALLRTMVMNVMGGLPVQFITLKVGLPYSG